MYLLFCRHSASGIFHDKVYAMLFFIDLASNSNKPFVRKSLSVGNYIQENLMEFHLVGVYDNVFYRFVQVKYYIRVRIT